MVFRVVYDNSVHYPGLKAAWGLACWVETPRGRVLFDTGGDGQTLLGNMSRLGLVPGGVDAAVLSHIHGDHIGGLAALLDLGVRPTVYVPAAFPASFRDGLRVRTTLVEVTRALQVLPGVYSTGEVGATIVEQALAVGTAEGLVVVTGCAHPGIVKMVRRAQSVAGGAVALVLGGFHLGAAGQSQISAVINAFQCMGVRRVAPCHCTGDTARRLLAAAFAVNHISAGVGWSMAFQAAGGAE